MLGNDHDYESAIEVRPGIHWVGSRNEDSLLHCNPYLLTIDRGSKQAVNIVIDPGSPSEFKITAPKLISTMGDLKNLSMITINHQDPDVCLSGAVLGSRFAPNAIYLMTENTWRLVAHTGIRKDRVRFVEKFHGLLSFKDTDRELILIPTPFCHFTGAFAIYDVQNRALFTGDLFGGVTLDASMLPLNAGEDNWKGIRMFHELYMPCNKALVHAVEQFEKLDPPVEVICPQHGSIIEGDLVKEFFGRMKRLKVGADLFSDVEDKKKIDVWNIVANEIMAQAVDVMGEPTATSRVADSEELMDMGRFDGKNLTIDKLPKYFIECLVLALTEKEVPKIANQIKVGAILSCESHGLPTPNIDLSGEKDEAVSEEFLSPLD